MTPSNLSNLSYTSYQQFLAAQDDRFFGLWRNWDHDPTLLAGLHWNLCRVLPGRKGTTCHVQLTDSRLAYYLFGFQGWKKDCWSHSLCSLGLVLCSLLNSDLLPRTSESCAGKNTHPVDLSDLTSNRRGLTSQGLNCFIMSLLFPKGGKALVRKTSQLSKSHLRAEPS